LAETVQTETSSCGAADADELSRLNAKAASAEVHLLLIMLNLRRN
jgi:hypothetical protein